MSIRKNQFRFDRRDFLKHSWGASLGLTGMAGALTNMRLINSAMGDTTSMNLGNYKALVCIFLRGGCDMNNMLIPVGSHPRAAQYQNDRGLAAVPEFIADEVNAGLLPSIERNGTQISPKNLTGNEADFALHSNCSNLKNLFDAGKLAWVNNVATLAVPTTKDNYDEVPLPIQLFSHSDQVTEWMAGISDKPFVTGWAGRIADFINAQNTEGQTSMLVTTSGANDLMVTRGGSPITQYSVNPTGVPVSLAAVGTDPDPVTPLNDNDRRYKAALDLMNYPVTHVIEGGYNNVLKRSIASKQLIGDALAFTDPASPDYIGLDVNAIFSSYSVSGSSGIGNQLKVIARLIIGRKCIGNERQMFFCDQGGYDHHTSINLGQPGLLLELDRAVGAFNQTLEDYQALGHDSFSYDQVTTFEMSDFNRTWTPNGTEFTLAGTDHAWGTHLFVMGGAVQAQQNILNGSIDGGRFFGTFPDLASDGVDSVPNNSRGRWIPTLAMEQYAARLANWFGVGTADIYNIFPNLSNFDDPFSPGLGLDFLPQVVA